VLVSLVALNIFLLDCKGVEKAEILCVLQMYVFDKAETFCKQIRTKTTLHF
jgi:hypothetical protein